MRIGIDIDGVMTDCEKYIIDYGTKFCVENNLTYRINLGEYYEIKMLNISEKNGEKFWNQYLKQYVTKSLPRENVAEVVDKLKKEGNEIYIITARNNWGLTTTDSGKMHEMTKKWLEKNKIYYDKLIFSEEEKVKYLIGNYIDIMIEDKPKSIKDISKKIPVLCYHNDYNADIKGKNIKRVYTWYDIYNKLKK